MLSDTTKARIEHELDARTVRAGAWLYRRTGGRLMRPWHRRALILTTTGRRSGLPRTVLLQYFPDGRDMVVVAANGGMPRHPFWYLNLAANPQALVEVGSRTLRVRAQECPPEDAARLWTQVLATAPDYDRYRRRTTRRIPLLRLVPEPDSTRRHQTAVVTGASSGIGRELARLAARDGYDVVLVARRAERLEALAEECRELGVSATAIPADLATSAGVAAVREALNDTTVDVLVNNAGVGGRGRFAVERPTTADLAMVRLNVESLVELTGAVLPGMVQRRHGAILNVASIAGYLPGPGQATYHASKAFVRAFSLALAEESRGTGVTVTTLSPGPVDTEFAQSAGIRTEAQRRTPLIPVMSAAEVAEAGWHGLLAGRSSVVPGLGTRVGLQSLRFLPWRTVARAAAVKPQAAVPHL